MAAHPKAVDTLDAAHGAILGAFVGDSLGSYLEFSSGVTKEKVETALTMPGGGHWGVSPGQITDDSEMGLTQLRSILASSGKLSNYIKTAHGPKKARAKSTSPKPDEKKEEKKKVAGGKEEKDGEPKEEDRAELSESPPPQEEALADKLPSLDHSIATGYVMWFLSKPFDTGRTTNSAFGWASKKPINAAKTCTKNAADKCVRSQSNGSLMRTTPLAVFAHNLPPEEIHLLVKMDTGFSHPNEVVVGMMTLYVLAIAHLVKNPGDSVGAIAACQAFLPQLGCKTTAEWFSDAVTGKNLAPHNNAIGWGKIAFQHGFKHLARGTPWLAAMKETLLAGGDTDTNCCIISGLLCACYGSQEGSGLPKEYVEKVLACTTESKLTRCRPKEYRPTRNLPNEIDALVAMAPSSVM